MVFFQWSLVKGVMYNQAISLDQFFFYIFVALPRIVLCTQNDSRCVSDKTCHSVRLEICLNKTTTRSRGFHCRARDVAFVTHATLRSQPRYDSRQNEPSPERG